MNIAALVTRSTLADNDQTAVRQGQTRLSYGELTHAAGRFASALCREGLRVGDRVGIYARNRPEYIIALLGIFKAGMVAVPVNLRLHPSELAFIADNAGMRVLVCDGEQPDVAESLEAAQPELKTVRIGVAGEESFDAFLDSQAADDSEVQPDDLAWLFYTSGTTGRPKGAMLSHRNLERMTVSCLADICAFQRHDIVLHIAPLSHGSGLYLLPALARGAQNLLLEQQHFDPDDVLATIDREGVTVIPSMAPTVMVKLLEPKETHDTTSLRSVVYGGAPVYLEHLRAAIERFGPVFVQIYGQGESPMTISYLRSEDHVLEDTDTLSSAGFARTDVEIRVVDENDNEVSTGDIGEICVRGDVVMSGYWGNEEATASALRNGWLHTGDLGRIGEDGKLFLLDRMNDMIISGGMNIYPREVEDVIVTHAAVSEAIVFGMPDPYWGEQVVAVVVARPQTNVDGAQIIEYCRQHLASFKKPKRVEFVDALPKNAYGKVLRRELRDSLKPSGIAEALPGANRPDARV